jgi:succinyl-diaminopimelate desuccinylase
VNRIHTPAIDAVELTRDLIRFNTINPPGNEQACAEHLGRLLEDAGFDIAYHLLDEGRPNLIARIGGDDSKPPLCFSGHIDVVPLGAAPWSVEPFAADIEGGKLYGRGSSDMKSGVAAIVAAAVALAPRLRGTPGLVLVITAGEECGCQGARKLAATEGALGQAGAVIIAEPTANRPCVGHKGVFWAEGEATGVTAHASMPHKGDNAVYKVARAITRLERFAFAAEPHPVLGPLTLNVGWVHGGININSVPDRASFGLDMRLIPGVDREALKAALKQAVGGDISFKIVDEADAVWSDPADPWVEETCAVAAEITQRKARVEAAPYFTDACALQPAYGGAPTLILGPGEPEQAHQTDEFCLTARISEAEAIFIEVARRWCGL